MSGLFGSGFNTMEAALVARERLQSTYASNIANAATPHAHADTRTFESFLAEETSKRSLPTTATQPGLDNDRHWMQLGSDSPAGGTPGVNGNNIDMQREMTGMAKNQLMHELTLRLLKGNLDGLNNAIRGGR